MSCAFCGQPPGTDTPCVLCVMSERGEKPAGVMMRCPDGVVRTMRVVSHPDYSVRPITGSAMLRRDRAATTSK